MKTLIYLTALWVTTIAIRNDSRYYRVKKAIADQYIVVLKPGYDVQSFKSLVLEDGSGVYNGTTIKHTYTKAIRGFSAKLTEKAVEQLLTREEVKYITQDGVVTTSSVASWGLDRISQRYLPLDGSAEFIGNGTGVNAYIIDTGIYPESLYFQGRATPAFDASPREGKYGIDCNGHGTHCAGIIGGSTYGVAPGVNLFGVRVLNCAGSGPTSDVIAGCDFVAKSAQKPAVASMSLGGFPNKALDNAVEGVIQSGVTVVAAAGNLYSKACFDSPARVNEVITVGATDIKDNRPSFSNFGKCVDIFAPGVDIPSAWIGGPEETRTLSGTSMACPHVSGGVAVALGLNPRLTPSEVKELGIRRSTTGVVKDAGKRSPNRLLYIPGPKRGFL